MEQMDDPAGGGAADGDLDEWPPKIHTSTDEGGKERSHDADDPDGDGHHLRSLCCPA